MQLNELSKNIFTVDSFLSSDECAKYISQAESMGFKSADVDLGSTRKLVSNIRNNERVDLKSPELADSLWAKMKRVGLPEFEGRSPIGLSPFIRFYKYSPGQKFNMHKDGRQNVGNDKTYFTILIYLNDDYIGGGTSFRQDSIFVEPKTGTALIFEHHLWHKGEMLKKGLKYVLRTDIVYA